MAKYCSVLFKSLFATLEEEEEEKEDRNNEMANTKRETRSRAAMMARVALKEGREEKGCMIV